MRISVIMVDGGFRENVYGAHYFAAQDFPENQFEVIWTDFYDKIHPEVRAETKVRSIALGHSGETTYHSSLCFNRGIREATGEILVIPDGDLIVKPDYLQKVSAHFDRYDRLAVYGYRHNDAQEHLARDTSWDELDAKCTITGPTNYGGCLCVRRSILEEINGYDEHQIFQGGFHANGFDIYTRLRISDVAVLWAKDLKLYHRWHPFSLVDAPEYEMQRRLIRMREDVMNPYALRGIDGSRNHDDLSWQKLLEKPPGKVQRLRRKLRGILGISR